MGNHHARKSSMRKHSRACEIYNDFEQSLASFNKFNSEHSISIVDKLFQRTENDIYIKVEFLKNELDKLKHSFQIKLTHIKKKLKKKSTRFNVKANHPKALLYNYQELKRLVLLNLKVEFEFNINEHLINRTFIGILTWYEVFIINRHLKLNDEYQIVRLNADIKNLNDICILENGNILIIDSQKYDLTVFNSEFKNIETIYKVDHSNFRPAGVATNFNHEIYVTDGYHKIYKLDLNMNKIGLLDAVMCTGMQELRNPIGICYYRKNLYVCSHFNSRIVVYTKNFKFKKSYQLDYHPYRIKIGHSDIACVTGYKQKEHEHSIYVICFYELPSFKLKHKYEKPSKIGLIFEIGSYFYEYSQRRINCFNPEGVLHEIIPIGKLVDSQTKPFDGITYINGKVALHISSKTDKQSLVLI